MNYLNFEIKTLRSPELLGAEPVDRATWLLLQTYCAVQENGGRILDCAEWGDRKWMQLVGVTKNEVLRECDLWSFRDGTLLVWGYPSKTEAEVIAKREAGRRGGSKRSEVKAATARVNGANGGRPKNETEAHAEAEPKQNPSRNPTERKEREGKGKKSNTPPTPTLNGNHGDKASLPLGEGAGITEGNGAKRLPTTPQSKRIALIHHRKLTTPWTPKEVRAYKTIGTVPEDDLAAVEAYYAANWPPTREVNLLRHDLLTFLNNFPGEVGRAKTWQETGATTKPTNGHTPASETKKPRSSADAYGQ